MKPKRTKLNECFLMPPLRHKIDGAYDVNKSEVVEWMTKQPIIRDYLFCTAANNGLIVYDKTAGTWQGRDYKPTPNDWKF